MRARAILISGLTVMTAMAGMLITGSATFASFGVGTIMVVEGAADADVMRAEAILREAGAEETRRVEDSQ